MSSTLEHHRETPAEEAASSITHLLGILLSLAGLAILVVLASTNGDARRIVTVSIYGVTLLLMYTASTSYHFVKRPPLKRALRIFDHASIYLLIAGTYTPVLLVSMRGSWGWSLFGVVWGLAVTGVILKLFFIGKYERISVTIYILMGWIALIGIRPFLAALPTPASDGSSAEESPTQVESPFICGTSCPSTTRSGTCLYSREAYAISSRCCCMCYRCNRSACTSSF